LPAGAEPHVSLVEWLEVGDEELRARYERLYFPRKDPRYLRRNALVAVGNVGGPEQRGAAEKQAADADPLLREHAEWALERLAEREG
jgi:epoxyqueuosine reductase